MLQCVNHGIAGHVDRLLRHGLIQQVLPGARRGCEVPAGQAACQLAICLLRPGCRQIAGTQTCFDMTNGNTCIECSHRGGH